jgi:peptidoglycan/LPS O-acetylase OafA/YrhL
MKQNKLLALESLRGMAAILVAIHHFEISSHLNTDFIKNAWLMVDFFFVLSGFVIALNYQDRIKTFENLKVFQFKRFLRLYPLHLIMLFIFLGIEYMKYLVQTELNLVANNPAFEKSDLSAFIANIFLVHNWTIGELSFNTPSWSISAEFYTYLIFASLLLLPRLFSYQFIFLSIALVVSSAVVIYFHQFSVGNLIGPSRCIFSFFLGVLAYNIHGSCGKHVNFKSSLPATLGMILSIFLVTILGGDITDTRILFIPVLFAITILLIIWTSKKSLLQIFLSTNMMVYLGTISYGIYMIHAMVWWIYNQLLRFVFKTPTHNRSDGSIIPYIENSYLSDLIMISGLLLIIFLSHLSYRFIETRFNQIRTNLN